MIDFVMALFDLTFPQALVRIDEDFSLGLCSRSVSRDEERLAQQRLAEIAAKEAQEAFLRLVYDAVYRIMLTRYRRLTKAFQCARPGMPDTSLSPAFVEALDWREWVEYWLDENSTFERWKEGARARTG